MNSEQHFAPIAALDLDPIKVKLMHRESGEGWSRAYADAMEFEYRRFLYLVKKFPHEQAAPLFDVDVFWHYHILDTMKYAVDCEAVFGYFLHHFPYVGLRGADDEATHHRIGVRMQELYEATFGEAYLRQKGGQAVTEWSEAATPATAWSMPATAWSMPATAITAFSQPATARTAFSQPATAITAFSQPATPVTALHQRGLNHSYYSRPVLASTQ